MNGDPWTDPDPAPGDFDADLLSLAPELVTMHDGDPAATLRILVSDLCGDACFPGGRAAPASAR